MIKSIIFDFDGTIADTLKLTLDCANQVSLKYLNKKLNYSKKIRDMKPLEIIRELGIPIHKVQFYLKETQALLTTKADDIKLFKGMKPLLKKLKRDYRIGIITTSKSELINSVLQKNNVDLIDFIFSGSSIFGKHAVLQELIKKHGLKKEETVYIGDEIRDVEASKKAGIKVIAVTWGYNARKALETAKADIVVDKPAELIKAINSL